MPLEIPENCPVNKDGSCSNAEVAAEKAVEKVFAKFGVNVHEPKELQKLQNTMIFMSGLKKLVDISILTLASSTVVALATWSWKMITRD